MQRINEQINLKDTAKTVAVKTALSYLDKDPESNIGEGKEAKAKQYFTMLTCVEVLFGIIFGEIQMAFDTIIC